jgi:hypothetical protein
MPEIEYFITADPYLCSSFIVNFVRQGPNSLNFDLNIVAIIQHNFRSLYNSNS